MEELTLVKYEMEWTIRSFLNRVAQWEERGRRFAQPAGSKAYAARQAAQWMQLATDAERLFLSVNVDHIRIVM